MALTGYSRLTILNKINNGQLLAFKISGAWKISMDEYDRYKSEGWRPLHDVNNS